jgi:uncharacterized protein (TIGR03643 family)
MKAERTPGSGADTDKVIRMAWEDRTSFEEIEKQTGLRESEVIRLMRRELKPGSFRVWRARVSGRITKHRKRLRYQEKWGDPEE